MKIVGKIYTALNANELEAGDIVAVADNLGDLKNENCYVMKLEEIFGEDFKNRFSVNFEGDIRNYPLAKLVCPVALAEFYNAFHEGKRLQRFDPITKKFFDIKIEPNWGEEAIFHNIIQNGGFLYIEKEAQGFKEHTINTGISRDGIVNDNGFGSIVSTKTRRMTNRELAEWLAEGNGQCREGNCTYAYGPECNDETVAENIFIRAWDEEEWHEPLVETYEKGEKKMTTKIEHTVDGSFFKMCTAFSETFDGLNVSKPYLRGCRDDEYVDIVSITPCGQNERGATIFCYELLWRKI